MKKISRSIPICLLLILFLLSACESTADESAVGEIENKQEVFTFVPQEVQPIEENPIMLPAKVSPEFGLHILNVQKPEMDEINNSDDVINAIVSSANQIVNIEGNDLVNYIGMETGDQPVTRSLSTVDGHLHASVQSESSEQDNANQENDEVLWGALFTMNHFVFEDADNDGFQNYAILIKYRKNSVNDGHSIGFSIDNISVNLYIDNDGGLNIWSNDEQNQTEYFVGNTSEEYSNSLRQLDNEWYYALVSMDRHLGYRFITWQENEPSNNAFYASDLGDIFNMDDEISGSNIWAEISFNSRADEVSLDIDSIAIYEFESFNDIGPENQAESLDYEYTNDQEKYDLAVRLFDTGDYTNAYTLFNELDGFDTGDYLAECERLLRTIEIQNPYAAGAIKKALKDQGMPIYEYLYVFQAESLESLDLSKCRVEDLSFIGSLPNLIELNLEKNAISDLSPLKDLHSLERLYLGENHVSDITPLGNLANLQVLDLSHNLIEDISCLNNIPSLVKIDLSTNDITEIADLSNLVNLESVDLSYNLVSSISAFENLPIKELNIMNTDINNLNAVANFMELETLKAGFRYLGKGNERYLLSQKYEIDDRFFNGLKGLTALAGHNNLKTLYLAMLSEDADAGETLESLAELTNLETLVFYHYSGASDPNVLGSLVNLKELVLDSAGIGFYDVSFLANLTKLEKLSIETFCYVEDLSVISGLTNLKELRMFKYGEDLSFLTGLKNLRLLELKNWYTVDDYSPLLALDNLEYLAMEEMAVNDLSIISQLESLKFLRIDSSQINNIKDVGQLSNLECFLMRNTEIVGDSKPEFFDRSLFDGLDHLKFATIGIRGEDGFGYDLGNYEFFEIMDEPPDIGIEEPDYDHYWIDNPEALNDLPNYIGGQHLVIDGYFSNLGENTKFTLPKNARNIFIFSYDDQPVRIELDGADNKGLERLVMGHIDVSREVPDGFGQGKFIIENLNGLSGCTNLKEIYIDSEKIDDISALSGLDKLEVLELPGNHIHTVGALPH